MAARHHHPWLTADTARPGELLAEIATANDTGTETIRLMSPLMPGEARNLQETLRAMSRLRNQSQ
jgi:hypothetical protein